MDIEKNLFLAKKYMVENICNAANIEGIAMTFPETQTICDGMSVAGKSIDDINCICDLKKAYQWIFANIENDIDISCIKKINMILGKYTIINSGQIRTAYDDKIRVMINEGNYYYPPVPKEEKLLNQDIMQIMQTEGVDKYFELFCYIVKSQLFSDGNKRTATLVTNMAMIKDGQGLFSIPMTEKLEFYQKLVGYYESDDNKQELKDFLKNKCISYND